MGNLAQPCGSVGCPPFGGQTAHPGGTRVSTYGHTGYSPHYSRELITAENPPKSLRSP
ncbi:hypothetical protein MIPYR_10778 [uncultured Microbacterium sp.]|uniref:Uncharacterized protein n=1 Tax=uncultured Microbacterium sp. TaxID=191216 RepID=A0A1Y5P092_9MICO|nr:hypothetical protein MIPYR_10778 [uncultured Microbacterium sp.]